MTSLQKAIDLIFVAKVVVFNLQMFDCPDSRFDAYLREVKDNLSFAESALVQLVPFSEVLSILKPVKK